MRVYRTVRSLDPATVGDLWAAHAVVREEVWACRAPGDASVAVVLDIDATLVEVHSEHKAGAAAHSPPPRRATLVVRKRQLALLGSLDRPGRQRRGLRRAHARPRRRRGPHRRPQNRRPVALPFADFDANAAWVALICWARSLVVWFQQLACAATAFAGAAAKRLRWALWHTPGRLVRSGRRTTVRLPANHPTTPHLTRIYDHIAAFHRHRRRRPQKHHNRHHKPPGEPTTRAPTPTTRPKQHPTAPQTHHQTPHQHPTPRPKTPTRTKPPPKPFS